MTLKQSTRGRVAPFIAMDVMRQANQLGASGKDVIHLEVGQPSSPAPAAVVEAAERALRERPLGYTEGLGLMALRERIAADYAERHHVEVDPARVLITVGASGGFSVAFLAAFDAGDRVALASPGYPSYRHILTALGLEAVTLPATREDRYQPSLRLLEALEAPIDGLIIASPSNPVGSMLSRSELEELAAWCREHGVRIVSDEIYHGITYGSAAETMLSIEPNAIVLNSFSKYYSMTGWRLGWMVIPPDLTRAAECLAQNLFVAAPTLSQFAAIAAFDCRTELDRHVERYANNRALLLEGLPALGLGDFVSPDGAFYVYLDVSQLTNDSALFCQRMLEETGVAITPGIDFDDERGSRTVRLAFGGGTDGIRTALERLRQWPGVVR